MSADVVRCNLDRGHDSGVAADTMLHLDGFQDATRNIVYEVGNANAPFPIQQLALPIHYNVGGPSSTGHMSPTSGVRQQSILHSREALRRKTPNGTLDAGFEGTAEMLHPHKHQVVPREVDPAASRNMKRTFLQHQQARSGHGHSWASAVGHSPTWPNLQYAHHPAAQFSQVDSVLHQTPSHFLGQLHQHGSTVPSVIQPSLQYLGPTALGSQGPGLYGPYWHDGTFVPYRPAAVRDPRFYPQSAHVNWFQPTPGHRTISPSTSWQRDNSYVATVQTNALPADPEQHRPAYMQLSHSNLQFPKPIQSESSWRPPTQTKLPQNNGVAAQVDINHGFSPRDAYEASNNLHSQRDEIYSWALQQYRELLTHIHQSRRQQHAGPSSTLSNLQRPSFYPKPPKPSNSNVVPLDRRKAERPSTESSCVVNQHEKRRGFESVEQVTNTETKSSILIMPSDHAHPTNVFTSVTQPFSSAETHRVEEISQTPWRNGGSQIGGNTPSPTDDQPRPRAVTAFSLLTKYCQQSEWQWLEGMHLCGCLAYGLGQYKAALSWYNQVLELDPKHLEATSNMAATLLALGRKAEAELHWSRVVKAAPNHFEAVEHLVGLFCTEQRSRDAIKVIEYVERCLRHTREKVADKQSECSSSSTGRSPCQSDLSDRVSYDFDVEYDALQSDWHDSLSSAEAGFGSSGFAVPGADNGRILALVHAKGNMLYGLGNNAAAARAFEDAVMIAAGRRFQGVQDLVHHILATVTSSLHQQLPQDKVLRSLSTDPILLPPDQALATAKLCFPHLGELPGLQYVVGGPNNIARRAVVATTSNSLLSLAKIFQDGMSNASRAVGVKPLAYGVRDVLALYYLSLSLQPSPSTANNVGILLASVQQAATPGRQSHLLARNHRSGPRMDIPGVIPGSGVALALQYYNYGLQLDHNHAHLYTNLGSLLKDIGQLDAAIDMYERAVKCDGKFDIALANLANAVKDKGRISDAIAYYRRAVEVNSDFAEAVCGLANALNSVCGWHGRGGIADERGKRDRWHVDSKGMLLDARHHEAISSGWIKRVVDIVDKQLSEGELWGVGSLTSANIEHLLQTLFPGSENESDAKNRRENLRKAITRWAGKKWEGGRLTRMIERATKRATWHWYRDSYVHRKSLPSSTYLRPQIPAGLTIPSAPTVLPFHTFTCPMSAKQIRLISQRNGLRISVCTLRLPWLGKHVFRPPNPPSPQLRIGYVSSDFNNHPLSHLMQSIFGMHDKDRIIAHCYATTASDNSVHRRQIEAEAPVFHDASSWSTERLVNQIVDDGIHILVNLNGYTRGARNEVFAARPAPIQMSFMGFAGTLGAEWCDYLLADETAIPPQTLRPWRRNVDIEDQLLDDNFGGTDSDWVYGENIIYCRDTFFCCDHRQSAPDSKAPLSTWDEECARRWQMRRDLFPQLSDETIIFGNFNQLYKIDPTTFRTWLRILARVPTAILWLLRFPDLGESHLMSTARAWAGEDVASRVIFTDVAPKQLHISRARICDLVLDTAECNAHTTAADVLWSGTPLLTLPRFEYKMCSRMAASILKGALPKGEGGVQAAKELVADSEDDYEDKAVALGKSLTYTKGCEGHGQGRLIELRRMLFEARWSSALFDTRRWVRDLEDAYSLAWKHWVSGEGGDIWLNGLPSGAK